MGIIGWIILGGLAGWIASMVTGTNRQRGTFGNIIVGIVGGLIGGFVLNLFGIDGVTNFNFWSLIVAVFGAIIALWIWSAVGGRRTVV